MNGISVDKETDTAMDPMFLMQQMELREALEAAESASDPYAAIDKLRAEIRAGADEQRDTFMTAADNEDWDAARTAVRQWQFLDRIAASASQLEARLDDEA
ncbi:MAG: hypothetical protein CSA54_04145 [Gammaproteobacteria bacterium]|nr:MAG: hypothetical protein CSA54_04145 [Gammaproteobacteria bacterium]